MKKKINYIFVCGLFIIPSIMLDVSASDYFVYDYTINPDQVNSRIKGRFHQKSNVENVHLTAENNNFNNASYEVSGVWGEETW